MIVVEGVKLVSITLSGLMCSQDVLMHLDMKSHWLSEFRHSTTTRIFLKEKQSDTGRTAQRALIRSYSLAKWWSKLRHLIEATFWLGYVHSGHTSIWILLLKRCKQIHKERAEGRRTGKGNGKQRGKDKVYFWHDFTGSVRKISKSSHTLPYPFIKSYHVPKLPEHISVVSDSWHGQGRVF